MAIPGDYATVCPFLIAYTQPEHPLTSFRFPADSPKKYPGSPYSIWDFVPASWSCPYEMERIGRMGDGGKWVCGMSIYEKLPATRPCVIYSFGVQTESSYGKSAPLVLLEASPHMLTRLVYVQKTRRSSERIAKFGLMTTR